MQKKMDPTEEKNLKANYLANKKLNNAKSLLNENKISEFYKEINIVLISYASDKFKLTNYDISRETIRIKFSEAGVSDSLVEKYIFLIEKAELNVYSGMSAHDPKKLFIETSDLLNQIQKIVI